MAAHGTVTLLTQNLLEITSFALVPQPLHYGSVVLLSPSDLLVMSNFSLAGTLPSTPPPVGPTVPTTGQIWPRGNW